MEALQDRAIMNYEIGNYLGVTWLESETMTLWNVGETLASASIVEAIAIGDGAPDPTGTTKVDGVFSVGAPDATHYIQLSSITDPSTAETGFKVGDIITFTRTLATEDAAMSTTGSAVWNNHSNWDVRVVAVDYDNNRVSVAEPELSGKFESAISSGLYGYAVKARPVHATVFLKQGLENPGVVAGVTQPPEFHIIQPADVREAVWTFSWDAYMKYQLIDPDAVQVHFFAGAISRGGSPLYL